MAPRQVNMGYIPDSFDSRDKQYSYKGEITDFAQFPNRKNLWKDSPELLEELYNQSESGSCVANATAAAIRFLGKSKKDSRSSAKNPSRLFIYYNSRALYFMDEKIRQWPADLGEYFTDLGARTSTGGTAIRNAMKSINLFGIASETTWPFSVEKKSDIDVVLRLNDRPTDAAYVEAGATHTVEYCRLDPPRSEPEEKLMGPLQRNADGIITLARLKQCLVEGYPVVFGFRFYCSSSNAFEEPPAACTCVGPDGKGCRCSCGCSSNRAGSFHTLKNIPMEMLHQKPPKGLGAHAVLAVGFEDSPDAFQSSADGVLREFKGRVLCQNSWGKYISHFWMPYSYIINYEATSDFWMLRELDPPVMVEPLTLESGWNLAEIPNSKGLWPGASIAFISRQPNTTEVFWVSPDGAVNGAVQNDDTKEVRRFTVAGIASAISGAISAVSRHPDKAEVWWIGKGGSIQGAYLSNGTDWVLYTLAPANSATLRTGITAVSRKTDGMEVFWVSPDNVVTGIYRYDDAPNGKWSLPFELDKPEAGGPVPTQSITAISTGENHMEVFWTQSDGSIRGRLYDSCWQTATQVTDKNQIASITSITAAGRKGEPTYVFFVAPDGSIQRCSNDESGKWACSALAKMVSARVDSGIAAVVVDDKRLDVFWIRPDNSIAATRGDGTAEEYVIAKSGTALATTWVGAFCRAPKTLIVCFSAYETGLVLASANVTSISVTTKGLGSVAS
jgi:C1A family cysteine protease